MWVTLLLLEIKSSAGQNPQMLTLNTCEEIFLKKNLLLLANQYNISAKEALLIQAKAYPNPTFNADINVYDPQNKKYFHVDSSGQKSFQLEQIIYLGGKRKTEIEIAKQNKALAESEFSELLRNLRFQLYTAFYSVNSQRIVLENYEKQLQILDTIITAYKVQAEKGNIPLKDLIRLKSVYIKINSNKSDLAINYYEQQKKLKLMVQTNDEIVPSVNENDFMPYLDLKALSELQDLAMTNRPDIKVWEETTVLAALNLELQKKQRIPDLALNTSYDQRGGAFKNQINAGITLPIPILNTNRGNIKAAEFDKKNMELYAQAKKLEVELETQQAWQNMVISIRDYRKVKGLFNEEFSQVNTGVNQNFRQRNISMLEFVDFVEAYNESLADYESIKRQLAISAAQINYVTATKIY